MKKQNPTPWHISDYIKTDEDVHALLAAEREPYEKALRIALVVLGDIGAMTDEEIKTADPRYYARRWRSVIVNNLNKEGIKDPTEMEE